MNTTRSRTETTLVAALFAAALAYALFTTDRYGQSMVIWISLHALAAVSLRFMLLIGEKNVATAAFLGIGAYTSAVATVNFAWPFPVAILLGGVVAGLASGLFGLVTLRVKGPYFMLISFSFTALLCLLYSKWDYIGGNAGIVNIYPPAYLEAWMPALVLTICAALVLALYFCERSSLGKLFKAIRDNDAIVASVGVDIVRIKVICLVLASVAVGVAGSLTAFTNTIITPLDFQFSIVVFLLAYVMVGGQSHVFGAVIGAALLTVLDQALQGHSEWEQIVFGAAIIVSMLLLPDGLIGVWRSLQARVAARGVAPRRVAHAPRRAGSVVKS
jgi:branched-chain amino acid transport system permease protein